MWTNYPEGARYHPMAPWNRTDDEPQHECRGAFGEPCPHGGRVFDLGDLCERCQVDIERAEYIEEITND